MIRKSSLLTCSRLPFEELLRNLVEALTAAAHVVHGEAERLVEDKAQ